MTIIKKTGILVAVLLTLGGISAKAQKLEALKAYANAYYELEFDDDGNEVINTICGEPAKFLEIVCPANYEEYHFKYADVLYFLIDLSQGNSEEEFILKFKNTDGEIATAIFYYDRVVNQLLLTFNGMNLAFVAKEDLGKFTVADKCN